MSVVFIDGDETVAPSAQMVWLQQELDDGTEDVALVEVREPEQRVRRVGLSVSV